MSGVDEMRKRDAFAIGAASPLDGLEASLRHAREIAAQDQLEAIGSYIEEAQNFLRTIRTLHQLALDEFKAAQRD